MAAKKTTKSGGSQKAQAQDVVAGQVSEPVVQVQPIEQKEVRKNMSQDQNELGSVVEYSSSVAEQDKPEPLPEREYSAQIKSAKVKKSQRDTKYYEVGFYVSPDSYPADYTEGDPDGTTLFFRRLSAEDKPQARYRLKLFCEAIGAPMPGKSCNVDDWTGLTAGIKVEHEEFEGEKRAQITQVIAG
jgi:hypothetical protein